MSGEFGQSKHGRKRKRDKEHKLSVESTKRVKAEQRDSSGAIGLKTDKSKSGIDGRNSKLDCRSTSGRDRADPCSEKIRVPETLLTLKATEAVPTDYKLQEKALPEAEPKKSRKMRRSKKKEAKTQDAAVDGDTGSSKRYDVFTEHDALLRKKGDDFERQGSGSVEAAKGETTPVLVGRKSQGQISSETQMANQSWTLSEPSAGRFLDQTPIFITNREGSQFLIAARKRETLVLALDASVVVARLPAPQGTFVRGFTLYDPQSKYIVIAYSNGNVVRWDWEMEEDSIKLFQISGEMRAILGVFAASSAQSHLFSITERHHKYSILNRSRSLFETKRRLDELLVLQEGQYIVARGPKVLYLGARVGNDGEADYEFLEVPLSSESTCTDARLFDDDSKSKKSRGDEMLISVAVGMADGRILRHVIHPKHITQENLSALPAPYILHWHREAVSSLKFSRDGVYLVSGGMETVLVLWQLETGHKQFLPHLTSEIKDIAINQIGDRYALHMGDNSIMVLNTSELKPVANFAGFQMTTSSRTQAEDLWPSQAAVLHPKRPHEVLITTGSASSGVRTRPFLQTYDIRASRHLTRQTLTRNNVTDLHTGPDQIEILPPDVNLLGISHDGTWLASLDEWMPPIADVSHLGVGSELREQQVNRREVHLKIWRWDSQESMWTLSTRVERPHERAEPFALGSGRVSSLVSHPSKNVFATIGEDDKVKIWKPRSRTRGGVAVRDESDYLIEDWYCSRIISLPHDASIQWDVDGQSSVTGRRRMLAYSTDGSLIAAFHGGDAGLSSFIDTSTGVIKATRPGFSLDGVVAIAFLQHRFVVVSPNVVTIWDLLTDSICATIDIATPAKSDLPLFAVNESDATIALVTSTHKRRNKCRVRVYKLGQSQHVYEAELEQKASSILSNPHNPGFAVLLADATVQTVSPAGVLAATFFRQQERRLVPLVKEKKAIAAEEKSDIDETEVGGPVRPMISSQDQELEAASDEEDRLVVRPQQLAKIFDTGHSYALPPVKEMFREIVRLFARKPLKV